MLWQMNVVLAGTLFSSTIPFIVAQYGLDTNNTLFTELCSEISLQDLSTYLGSTGQTRPNYAFEILQSFSCQTCGQRLDVF